MAKIEESWQQALGNEFEKPYMKTLSEFLKVEQQNGIVTYPKNSDIFNAFNHTPFNNVKVVILGQDPYHGAGQAHGLSFSVQKGIALPPSLKNIFKELEQEFTDFKIPASGDLTKWADQGVLMLNATLTVRAQQAGSHQNKGWEQFTDHVISTLSAKKENLIFLLWGNYAKQKESLIDTKKHFVLKAAHPSPFSAYNGFFGCNHFIKTNEILKDKGFGLVDWQL
jgi:uracil-DNA glycosylase